MVPGKKMRRSPLRRLGRIVLADDPVAADATCARLMGLDPRLIFHIEEAGRFLGNMDQNRITMLGEGMPRNIEPFRVLSPVSEPPDQGMRSALEHGQKHFGYAARVRRTLSRPGARHWARVSWLSGSDAKARTLSAGTMSAGKSILVANRSGCQTQGRPVLPVLAGHFASTPGHFSRVPNGQRAQSYAQSAFPHPPMMIRRLAERQ